MKQDDPLKEVVVEGLLNDLNSWTSVSRTLSRIQLLDSVYLYTSHVVVRAY
jgi:hypothetical protein